MEEIKIKLPPPHWGQKKVLASKARYISLLCGRRWGKSVVAQRKAVTLMCEGKRVAYLTPKYQLAKRFFAKIVKCLPKRLIKGEPNKTDLTIELITGGEIMFFSGESTDNFRGHEFDYVIIDEAASIPDLKNAWNAEIGPTLSITKGGAMFIGTPSGRDYFWFLYQKGVNAEPGYESFHFPSNTSPYFPAEEWEEKKETTPEAQFRQEYEAIPMASQNNPFGNHIDKNIRAELSQDPTVVFGVDVASISDYTVVIGLDAQGRMSYFDRFRLSWPATQKRLLKLPRDVMVVVDSMGVGEVEIQYLALEMANVRGFKFTTTSKPQVMWELVGDVEKGNITYNETTSEEMKVFEMHRKDTGHIKFGAKSGFNDDCVCALAIANHFLKMARIDNDKQLYFC